MAGDADGTESSGDDIFSLYDNMLEFTASNTCMPRLKFSSCNDGTWLNSSGSVGIKTFLKLTFQTTRVGRFKMF